MFSSIYCNIIGFQCSTNHIGSGDLSVSSWNVCWVLLGRERRGETVSACSSPSLPPPTCLTWSRPTLGPWRSSPWPPPSWGGGWPTPAGGGSPGRGGCRSVWRCPGGARAAAADWASPAQCEVWGRKSEADKTYFTKSSSHQAPQDQLDFLLIFGENGEVCHYYCSGSVVTTGHWTVNHQRSLTRKDQWPDFPTTIPLRENFIRNRNRNISITIFI